LFFCAVLAAGGLGADTTNASAQSKATKPTAKSDKSKTQLPKPSTMAAPRFVVPSVENILILIRSTLLGLNQAMETGNYTVLRDLASPAFREANSAGKLYQLFANLGAQRISLAAVAILTPKLSQTPNVDANGRLHIQGFFPGEPVRIDFGLVFEAIANQWRLFSISVNPVKSVAIPPVAEASGKDATPAAKGK
jgi:hypothetical protein